MLIDAGELSPLDERTFTSRNAPIRPGDSKKPFEWIVQYIRKNSPEKRKQVLDYALITHFHDDHFGAWYPDAPGAVSGKYKLTGITGVGDKIPIRNLLDRGAPDYNYPYDLKKFADKFGGGEISFQHTMQNYFAFVEEQKRKAMRVDSFRAGSNSQIVLLSEPGKYKNFSVRNVKINQWIWTGKDSTVNNHFGSDATNKKQPDENSLSLAITINYGDFTYYSGGDNAGQLFRGDDPLRDVETEISGAIGNLDVAVMDHHGNRDAINEKMIENFKARVWIGLSWSADHPGHEVLLRLTNKNIYDGPVDLFCTNMLPSNKDVIGPLVDRAYKSQQGHIVVRVLPGGKTYYIIVLDDSTESMNVKSVFGPYITHSNK